MVEAYGVAPPRYRLPAGLRLGRVRLQVSDLARSLDYYQQVLGLRVTDSAATGATLAAATGETLVELVEKKGARHVPRTGLLGLYHFAILLPDRAALGRLLGHLGGMGARPGMSDHLVSEAIYLQDPDNLGIEVYADRPRDTWQPAMGQLRMASEPLDVGSVLAAAVGRPWDGMPAGTQMGHLHLHVGDIEQGAAFYHEQLGLDKIVWSYPGALFLSAGGYHHHLGTNTWARGAPSASDDDARLLDWEILLPTADDVALAGESLGASVVSRERDMLLARDPWGTAVQVRAERRAATTAER